MGRNDELPLLKQQLAHIEKKINNISSTLPEAELKSEESKSRDPRRDEDLKRLEDRIQDLESNLIDMEINHQMLIDLAETVNVADLKSMISTTSIQNDLIERANDFMDANNATIEEIENEMDQMRKLLKEIIGWDLIFKHFDLDRKSKSILRDNFCDPLPDERNTTEKRYNEMKYVEFGAQENRDFDYEKFVIGERIQLLENQMRYKEESTGKFINVIKDLVIQIQTLGLAFLISKALMQPDL